IVLFSVLFSANVRTLQSGKAVVEMVDTFILRGRSRALEVFNRAIPWYRLPKWLGLANLSQIRHTLRSENRYDTKTLDGGSKRNGETVVAPDASILLRRTADGTYNDLEGPNMGARGTRFGRNVPLERATAPGPTDLMTPNPRTVSEKLLARRQFVPASSLNVL